MFRSFIALVIGLLLVSAESCWSVEDPVRDAAHDECLYFGALEAAPNPDKAIAACGEYLARENLDDAQRSYAYNARANAYKEKKDYARALIDYDKAIIYRLKWGRNAPHVNEKDEHGILAILIGARSETFFYARDFDDAIKDDTTLIEKYGDTREGEAAYFHRAVDYFMKKDYARALADLAVDLKAHPDHGASYAVRGDCYAALGDYERAIADFSEAIRLTSGRRPNDFNKRGIAFFKKGLYQQAIDDFRAALALSPDNEQIKANLKAAETALAQK